MSLAQTPFLFLTLVLILVLTLVHSMSAFAYNVTLEDFDARVIQPSLETPVLVDFWSPGSGPCQSLKPILHKLVEEYGGRFLLAKVNADEYPQLVQHFGVRSVPSVKVLFGGRIVDEFSGDLPEAEIRAFIDRVVGPAGASLRDEAATLVADGQLEEALAVLGEASRATPEDEAVRLDAVEVLLDLGRQEEAQQLLAAEFAKEADRAQSLRARAALAAGGADIGELQAKLAAAPEDHATRLELAKAQAAAGLYREALESALEVIRRDRFFDEGAGRKAMLQIFEAIASSERYDDLVREYRRALSGLLN